jgi:hypothetical protein
MPYTGVSGPCKHLLNDTATSEQIKQYSELVQQGENQCHLQFCPQCNVTPEHFKRHSKRRRKFLVIVEQVAQVVIGLLTCWKCPGCNTCFTGYPPFALPYKRYTLPTICAFSRRYVENDLMTYRKLIQQNPIGSPYIGNAAEWQLDHSTVHRWISALGQFDTITRKAQDLILQADPASTVCRDLAGLRVSCRKYTVEKRKTLLLACRRLLDLEQRFYRLFDVSIFHNLATKCAYS